MDVEPMPEKDFSAVHKARDLTRRLAAEIASHGIHEGNILTGMALALNDLAVGAFGSPEAAAEWLRTAIDLAERWDQEGRYGKS
ncbi:MAG: hypothetical protein KUG65_10990 [Sphingomonadaceae bacterium]|nr:hypothetical protein [Sphingomonadaceae bacterium]